MSDLFAKTGDPAYKYAVLVVQRRIAALCGRHRSVQRLDKKIALLREDLGLPPLRAQALDPAPLTGKDFSQYKNLAAWDTRWAQRITASNIDRLTAALTERGYALRRERSDDGMTTITLTGAVAGRPDELVLRVINNADWCTSAERNGRRVRAFWSEETSNESTRGVPPELAAEDFDGWLHAETAQHYARSWSILAEEMKL